MYCLGSKIKIDAKERDCPDHVFQLSINQSFEINGFTFNASTAQITATNQIERFISADLQNQIRTDRIHRYGINLTNYDQKFELLTKAKTFLKDLELKKLVVPFTTFSPFTWVEKLFDDIWSAIKIVLLLGLAVLAIFALSALSPFLQLALLIVKPLTTISKKIFKLGTKTAQRTELNVLLAKRRLTNSHNRFKDH